MENWKEINLTYEIQEILKTISAKKKRLDALRPLPSIVVRSIQESLSLEWTYNSNSIEGNTLTLQETRVVLEDGMTIGGKSMREHFEAVNHKEAIERVEMLAKPDYTLRERDILDIHGLVLNKIEVEHAGRLRNGGVRIAGANFIPPNAQKVPDLFEDLIIWINDTSLSLHPVVIATIFHHRFVWIHPFFDGNGRSVRLVFNLFLMKQGYPPAIILKVDRKKYYTALNAANNGNMEKLLLLMCQAVLRSLDIYLSNLDDTAGDYAPINNIAQEPSVHYGAEYLGLLARQGKLDAYKEGHIWYTTEKAVQDYVAKRRRKRI